MSPLPLTLSLAGLERLPARPWAGTPRSAIEWAARLGYRSVHLDATALGFRPRELDRSARRDLAALLRREELSFSGLDLWIPPEHFSAPAHMDRAAAAADQAMSLAADLAALAGADLRAAISLSLPPDAPALEQLAARAETKGVRLADHAWPPHDRALAAPADGPLGVGLDPAVLLLAGASPQREASRLGARLASARLSDATTVGRAPAGSPGARMDLLAYHIALETAGYIGPIVVDLRGLADQAAAASAAIDAW